MKKILILEDEENIRSFVVINLQRAGYITVEAATGQEALDKLREHPDVDVAVLDIMLPDIDGFEVCRRIRATSKRIGIIMLTARTQEMDKVWVVPHSVGPRFPGPLLIRTRCPDTSPNSTL